MDEPSFRAQACRAPLDVTIPCEVKEVAERRSFTKEVIAAVRTRRRVRLGGTDMAARVETHMVTTSADPANRRFADVIRYWRVARRMSQLALATGAEISSRPPG